MRKFTKFFMLLFALVGATVGYAQSIAENPTPISGLTSGFYVIKNVNPDNKPANVNNYYIYCANTENGALKLTATAPSADVTNPATIDNYLWYVNVKTTGENVTVTISSVVQTGYWPVATTGNKSLVVTDNPQVFDLKTTNQTLNGNTSAMTEDMIANGNTCLIGNTTSYNDRNGNPQTYSYFHVNTGNNLGSWHDANHESLLYAQFYAATGVNTMTLNYKDGERNTFTKKAAFFSAQSLDDLRLDFYTIDNVKNASEETVNEITESGTYTVNCTSHFPFELMTITDGAFANANFYTMQIANGSRDVVYEDGTGVTTMAGTKGFNKKSLWAFEQVSGTEANFKIYNLAAGATTPMAVNGTGNETPVGMGTYVSGDASTDQFTLTTSDTGYAFLHTKATTYLNASVSLVDTDADGNLNPNTGLGLWGANGDGSRFFFTSVDDMTAAATEFIGNNDSNYPASEGYINVSTTATQDANFLYAYNNQKTFAKLNTALESVSGSFDYKNPYGYDFNPSKVYQIISYNDANCKGWTIYSNTWCGPNGGNDQYDDRKILIGADRPIAETFVWFEAVDHGYRIHHANSDYRFVQLSAFGDMETPDMPVATNAGGVYVITPARTIANVFALSNYNTENKWLHCGKGDGNTIVRAQAPADNDGDLWLIKEVSEIPVEIGAAKWSTLCLPVAVTVPNDANLKVYTVSGVDNGTGVMTLNVVEPGTVVAKKTGLLLASTSENGGTYNFAVSTEAGTSYNNNILMGTTARRIGFNTNDSADPTAITTPHYALAQKDGVVAFYPSTLNILPANKAYIKKADIASSGSANRALYMTGNTTGVDSTLIQNGEAEEYYDLNGRRVLYPTTGIYATRSGKKVFIK